MALIMLMLDHCLRLFSNINPLTGKLFNLNFHPLEVVSSEWKLFGFDKIEVNSFQILLIDVTFYL